MRIKNIFSNVLKKISLSEKETKEIENSARNLIKILKKNKLNAQIGGSLAKKTILKKENQDVDIFVILDQKSILNFEKIIKKTKIKYELIHGSRDYIKIKRPEIIFELIPVLKLKKNTQASNITDFSLMHVKYIKNMISKNEKLKDEIKLAKAFCHAQKCYGAESYIGGFSGYAIEVLVCHYGSFLKFLKKIQKETIIDPKKYFKNKNEILREINQSKLQSPIILVDPTYKYRNVCAGLTGEVYTIFIKKSKEFLKSPSEKFFTKEEFDLNDFVKNAKKNNLEIYRLDMKTDRQEGDIAGTKMKKLFKFLIKELNNKQQKVINFEFNYIGGKEATGYISIKSQKKIEIIGPPIGMKDAIKKFKKIRKKTYTSKNFICAKEKVSIKEIFNNNMLAAESMGSSFDFKKIN